MYFVWNFRRHWFLIFFFLPCRMYRLRNLFRVVSLKKNTVKETNTFSFIEIRRRTNVFSFKRHRLKNGHGIETITCTRVVSSSFTRYLLFVPYRHRKILIFESRKSLTTTVDTRSHARTLGHNLKKEGHNYFHDFID